MAGTRPDKPSRDSDTLSVTRKWVTDLLQRCCPRLRAYHQQQKKMVAHIGVDGPRIGEQTSSPSAGWQTVQAVMVDKVHRWPFETTLSTLNEGRIEVYVNEAYRHQQKRNS